MSLAVDETQPLLRSKTHESVENDIAGYQYTEVNNAPPYIDDFNPNGDVDNPLEWPTPFKWGIVLLLAMTAFTVYVFPPFLVSPLPQQCFLPLFATTPHRVPDPPATCAGGVLHPPDTVPTPLQQARHRHRQPPPVSLHAPRKLTNPSTFTCIGVVPLANSITHDLSPDTTPSRSIPVLLVTIWELGEAAGPLLIAPLSEIFGRYPVLNACNILFILATALAASSTSVPVFVGARALTGLAVATNVLAPAIVGDMFVREERGGAVSLIFLAPLVGGALGPAIASAVAEAAGWRRVMWMSVALATVCETLFLVMFRETYKVAILRRRAKRLGLAEGVDLKGLRDAVLRPAIVFGGSGVLMAMCFFGSVVFSYYYLMSTTLSEILLEVYRLPQVEAGFCFISFSECSWTRSESMALTVFVIGVGSTLSVIVCNRQLDKIYIRMKEANKGVGLPEFRLPLCIVGALTMPLAVSAYGWIAELRLPLTYLLVSVALLGTTLMLAMIPLMSYVVDAFGIFSASAMTGVIVSRCLMSTFLPLATGPLVEAVGYGWTFTVFAGVIMALAPVPILMLRYGARWRKCSKYTRDQ